MTITHLQEQKRLLTCAIKANEPLAPALERAGWSYDDLIYSHSFEKSWQGEPAVKLDEFDSTPTGVPVVSFFTGCGL